MLLCLEQFGVCIVSTNRSWVLHGLQKIPILNLRDSCHLANGNHLELTFQTKPDIYIITNFKNINIRARKIELEC